MLLRMERMPQLPEDLLVRLLSCVDVQQRIGSCSLVCHSWRTAAAAATPDISITLRLQDTPNQLDEHCCSLAAWLGQHGGQSNSLTLACTECDGWPGPGYFYPEKRPPAPSLYLPCSQLCQLKQLGVSGVPFTGMTLHPDATAAAAAAAVAAAAAAAQDARTRRVTRSFTRRLRQQQSQAGPDFLLGLSSLTKLQLANCSIAGWGQGLAGLSELTQLQHLQLEKVEVAGGSKEQDDSSECDVYTAALLRTWRDRHNITSADNISTSLAVSLPQLVQLTYLSITERRIDAGVLQGLSRLQQLQELRLQECVQSAELCKALHSTLAQLPDSLSVLSIAVMDWESRSPPVVLDGSSNAARLRQLSNLKQLELQGIIVQDAPGLLGGLSQLTSLDLGSDWYGEGAQVPCPPWSALQQLRELRLDVHKLDMLQGLPLGLTLLELSWSGSGLLSSSTAPSVAQLTALQHFKVEGFDAKFCPSVLQGMQQLQYLSLYDVAGEGLRTLLSALQNMQQLQLLRLGGDSCTAFFEDDEEDMQLYAALTASSQLTELDLYYDDHILADGAAQYMFAEGKQLPHLKKLILGMEDWDNSDYPQPFGEGDLARLAAACPALEQFWALPCIQEYAGIADLALLMSVTELKIGGWDCLPANDLIAALVNMSQLVDLQVTGVRGFEVQHLAALTKLTGLRHLVVNQEGLEEPLLDEGDWVSLHSRASPPDVWQQLRELCLQDPFGAHALEGRRPCKRRVRQRSVESSSTEDSSTEDSTTEDSSDW